MESHASTAARIPISLNQLNPLSGPNPTLDPSWTIFTLVAFRLVCAYEVLYNFPSPLNVVPWLGKVFSWYDIFIYRTTLWASAHILGLHQSLSAGQGDSVYGWIQNLTILGISVVIVVIWSVFDRKRHNYQNMQEWLWLYVRLALGCVLIFYGAAKVVKTQFPDVFLWRLLEPYGESSPMGLLWTFMAYSKSYNLFTGFVELLAGAFLFIPRLATLGAFLSIGATVNVFILNMSYDVPVKLASFNLLLMGVLLLSRELRRMLNVFLFNRRAEPVEYSPLFRRRWLNTCVFVGQILLLLYVAGGELYSEHKVYKEVGDGSPNPAIYGIYAVDEFSVDGQVRLPLFTDATRWRRITFDRYNGWSCFFDGQILRTLDHGTCVALFPGDGPMQRFSGDLDESKKTLELTLLGEKDSQGRFSFDRPSPDIVTLNGMMNGKKIQTKLRKLDPKSFRLNERGFHWINEFPFNR